MHAIGVACCCTEPLPHRSASCLPTRMPIASAAAAADGPACCDDSSLALSSSSSSMHTSATVFLGACATCASDALGRARPGALVADMPCFCCCCNLLTHPSRWNAVVWGKAGLTCSVQAILLWSLCVQHSLLNSRSSPINKSFFHIHVQWVNSPPLRQAIHLAPCVSDSSASSSSSSLSASSPVSGSPVSSLS